MFFNIINYKCDVNIGEIYNLSYSVHFVQKEQDFEDVV